MFNGRQDASLRSEWQGKETAKALFGAPFAIVGAIVWGGVPSRFPRWHVDAVMIVKGEKAVKGQKAFAV